MKKEYDLQTNVEAHCGVGQQADLTGQGVDLSKIKPGDELVIRVHVVSRNNGGLWVNCAGVLASYAMDATAASIVSHTPKALAVGDRVTSRGHAARVLLVSGGDACIAFDGKPEEMHIRPLHMLERLP